MPALHVKQITHCKETMKFRLSLISREYVLRGSHTKMATLERTLDYAMAQCKLAIPINFTIQNTTNKYLHHTRDNKSSSIFTFCSLYK